MFGLTIAFTIVWWVIFFAVLPFGVHRQSEVQMGTDPGAPANPMLWRKAAVTTLITVVLVGSIYAADVYGLVDLRSLIFGEPRNCINCGSEL